MEPGDTLTYEGPAVRAVDDAQVQVDGTFVAVEQRDYAGDPGWLVEDERTHSGSWSEDVDRELHRYVIPAPAQQSPASSEDRPDQ